MTMRTVSELRQLRLGEDGGDAFSQRRRFDIALSIVSRQLGYWALGSSVVAIVVLSRYFGG